MKGNVNKNENTSEMKIGKMRNRKKQFVTMKLH